MKNPRYVVTMDKFKQETGWLLLTLALLTAPGAAAVAESRSPVPAAPAGILPSIMLPQTTRSDASAAGTPEAEVDSLVASLDEIEFNEGPFSPALFEPLMALAEWHIANDNAAVAEELLLRAQHIAHRNEGVFTLTQLAVIERLQQVRIDQQDALGADDLAIFRHFVATRNDPGLASLPYRYDLVEWFTDTGQFQRARRELDDISDLIRAEAGPNDLKQLEVMRLTAMNRRLEGGCCRADSLRDALALLSRQPQPQPDLEASLTLEMADAMVSQGRGDKAIPLYQRAIANGAQLEAEPRILVMSARLKAENGNQVNYYRVENYNGRTSSSPILREMTRDEQLAASLQEPQIFFVREDTNAPAPGFFLRDAHDSQGLDRETDRVVGEPLGFYFTQLDWLLPQRLRKDEALATLQVVLSLTVTESGRARDVQIIASNAPNDINRLMRKAVAKAKFRPAFIDGVPTETTTTITQTFCPNASCGGKS